MRTDGLFLSDGSFLPFSVSVPEREGEPIKVAVTLTDSQLVYQLRSEIDDLNVMISELKEFRRQAEYGYTCQVQLNYRLSSENEELWDLLEAHGIRKRPLKGRRKKG